MAIQNRRGPYAKYNASKMVAGEFAVATDEQKLFIAFAPGESKQILTEDDADLIDSKLDNKAPKASPTFTGVPEAPTAAVNTSTTQIATTAFVQQEIADHGGGGTISPVVTNGNLTFTID